jgi:hypothetical protein
MDTSIGRAKIHAVATVESLPLSILIGPGDGHDSREVH